MKKSVFRISFLILVVLAFSVTAFATTRGQLGTPAVADSVSLSSFPSHRVDLGNGNDEIVTEVGSNPAWTWRIPSFDSLWYYHFGSDIDVSSDDYSGQMLVTGYVWPYYSLIDVSDLTDPTNITASYTANFALNVGSPSDHSGEIYVSLVPRFRLLRSTGGQVAFVNGESVWNAIDNAEFDGPLSLAVSGSQTLNLQDYHDSSDYWTTVKYIEIKWQFNIRIENVYPDTGIDFYVDHTDLNFTYEVPHLKSDGEIFTDKVGELDDKLTEAGDLLGSVPKPDVDHIIKPVDELVDTDTMYHFSRFTGLVGGILWVGSYFTIVGIVMLFSYALFGRKD